MYLVIAERPFDGSVEYVSAPLPNAKANELASALRRHTRFRVIIESLPAVQTGELRPQGSAN